MNCQYVHTPPPELYNGVGGELPVEEIDFAYMGPMIKAARTEANLTQDELAEQLGVTTRYIMAIENEGKCPALDVWFRLIRALHTSADAIVYPEGEVSKSEDEQLILMIRMLNSRDKAVIKTAVQSMLDNQ